MHLNLYKTRRRDTTRKARKVTINSEKKGLRDTVGDEIERRRREQEVRLGLWRENLKGRLTSKNWGSIVADTGRKPLAKLPFSGP